MTLLTVLQVSNSPKASARHQPLVLGLKMQCFEEFEELERFQPAELARWWAALQLQPTCALLVGLHVDKHEGSLDCRCKVTSRYQLASVKLYCNTWHCLVAIVP